jgi:hypothetical protein
MKPPESRVLIAVAQLKGSPRAQSFNTDAGSDTYIRRNQRFSHTQKEKKIRFGLLW